MVGPTLSRLAGRVPVIKFRKGGLASGQTAAAAQPAAAAPAATPAQQAAAISTSGPLSDVNLPARYRRLPLSQEEIDHINGGGIFMHVPSINHYTTGIRIDSKTKIEFRIDSETGTISKASWKYSCKKNGSKHTEKGPEKSPSVAVAIIRLPQDVLTKEQLKLNLVVHKIDKKK